VDNTDPLTPLPEDWDRVLVVVAHPDDIEFCGAAGAVARWTGLGKQVGYVLLTSGEAGIDGLPPERTRAIREREQVRSCAAVGVDDVEFVGLPDGELEYGIALRKQIMRVLRRHRPDVVVTLNFRDHWGHGAELNQPDHVAAGRALVDAVGYASNRWIFRDLVDQEGLQPWRGIRHVLAAGSPLAAHGVRIDDTFDAAVDALAAHKIYNHGLRWPGFDPRSWLADITCEVGRRVGSAHAVAFEVIDT
jgi:LmbE family N-acetylglucosaminyl deacetylase